MKPVRVALATLAATVVAAALAIASFTDSPSAAATTHTTKPTIVLVHGAWADSGSWDDVVSRLQHDGYTETRR